jgi:tRNA(Ile)-lysidine synthase TilS/MesJ
MPLRIIRPLCLIEEADLIHYAALRQYQKQIKLCPFEHISARTKVKELLEQMKQLNSEALDSISAAMSNIKFEYLPKQNTEYRVQNTD